MVPRGHFSRPDRFFVIRTAFLTSRPLFQLPERPFFLDGRFFGCPSPRLSSRTGILASRTLVFHLERHISSGAALFLPEPKSS
jgi:hypothetical protein